MILCIEPNEKRPGGGSKRGGCKRKNRIASGEQKKLMK